MAAPHTARGRAVTARQVAQVGHVRQQGHEPELPEAASVARPEAGKEAQRTLLKVDEVVDAGCGRGAL